MCADAPARPAGAPTIVVELVHAPAPHRIERVRLVLPAGATAGDALRASGIAARLGAEALDTLRLGRGGRLCEPATVLHDDDRLELLRPLRVDPKEARRLRMRRDGLKKAPRRAR